MDIANKSHLTSIKMAFSLCDLTGRPETAVLTSQLMKSILLCKEDLVLPHVLGCVMGVPVKHRQWDRAEGAGQPCLTSFLPAAQTLCSTSHPPPLFLFSICLFIPSLFSAIVFNGNSISAEVTLQESYSTEGFL